MLEGTVSTCQLWEDGSLSSDLRSCHTRHGDLAWIKHTLDAAETPAPSTLSEEYPLLICSLSVTLTESPDHTPSGGDPLEAYQAASGAILAPP